MNTPSAASAARVFGCGVLVIGGGPAGSTASALLAGDVFGKPQIHGSLLLFNVLYYAASLFNFRRTLKTWWMRKLNILVVDETGATVN